MTDIDHYTDVPVESAPGKPARRIPRSVTFVVLGLILLVVLFFGAIFIYAKVINDSPSEFTAADLDAALSARGRRRIGDGRSRHDTTADGRNRSSSGAERDAGHRARIDRRCGRDRQQRVGGD